MGIGSNDSERFSGFLDGKKPTSRMLYNELINETFKRKGAGDEIGYRKLVSELTIPVDENNVWGDALDLTERQPSISDEKIGRLFASYCLSRQP